MNFKIRFILYNTFIPQLNPTFKFYEVKEFWKVKIEMSSSARKLALKNSFFKFSEMMVP